MSKRSEPRIYPYPPQQVFDAAVARLPGTNIKIINVDPGQGTIWGQTNMSAFSWGEKVTVFVYPGEQGQAAVVVDSGAKFGLFTGGAHKRNHKTVFTAIEQGLGLAGGEQAPGPYPYQQAQPGPAEPPQPPPGATTF